MSAHIIDGREFSAKVKDTVAKQVAVLKDKYQVTPGLAVVLVGEDPASQVYVRNKNHSTVEAGMKSEEIKLPDTATEEEVLAVVNRLNEDDSIHGILVQLPLPDQIDETAVIDAISPEKDVDGFHVINTGRQAVGLPAMVPCTPRGCIMMLQDYLGDLSGLNAVVVGRSNIVGKPMASLLLEQSCTVTIAHSRTKDLPDVCRRADILVAAVGRPEMIKGDWVKPGATVIDVGINRIPKEDGKTRLVGDVEFETAKEVAGAITPVPGGVGPMTIACLLANTITAACRIHDVDEDGLLL
ncbi:bifunctional methylenetetrahydrofolate dehydrogenase/methenyltetrahydrofolate cyclohydrolase FolD [Sneathiella sp. P13V-1]|uniref:bifunctional methylenetetrahydrofolate dehydrogenase/methenyltetrahydrofolate cyclohydrolase FolD n=1 Tax=Sneathiella sp. P13V-1 TaxID=2697366 RepID=UPI00187B17C5|nr:bifunctional methylenetetrahydrofolate dehydrogenase/methenyltetrahydrofolate cyclohydrolase FolD [Sneathiella sp. P13V-1]MBE7636419.1 bifunctional methylenetetrahydrofolate dehydrogenase/methenyltetrahydrofolate cyclohydrolase FolD [Sneathiella sp. P13V-1]